MDGAFLGKYKARCVDNNDPTMTGRIRAEVPFPLGKGKQCWSTWALPCLPPGKFDVPAEGDGVWIEFERGDPNQPIWVGVWYKGRGTDPDNPTLAPFQEVHAALTDRAGNNVEVDNIEQDDVADAEHRGTPDGPDGEAGAVDGGHDHRQGQFYTPHRRVWMSETGHHLELNDHPGLDGYVRFFERAGRLLEMTEHGLVRLVAMASSAIATAWRDLNGNPVTAAQHALVMADQWNDSATAPGQFIQMTDMAGATLTMTSTPGQEEVVIKDFWGQYVRVHSVSGNEYIELSDKHGNSVTLENGKIVIAVPAGTHVYVGDDAGTAQALATKAFVASFYNLHTHISSAPGSPTSPPIIQSPLTPGLDITNKQLSE